MFSLADLQSLPKEARALTALGDETAAAVLSIYQEPQGSLFPDQSEAEGFAELADALRSMKWTDQESAKLLGAYKSAIAGGREIPVQLLTRWVLAHAVGGPADAIIDCIEIEAPDEVDIIRALPRKGSQKIVFEASWRLRQREVILKKVIGPREKVERILRREELPHPLTLAHSNIIETYRLVNRRGEVFLVEQKLDDVLNDERRSGGVLEAANLLFDIAKAIMYLHDNRLVHGDIKPDNIGRKGDRYVLLDFGICRSVDDFTDDVTPTGSLRTRAPELIEGQDYAGDPYKVDIWALGATVFNYIAGRYPLINATEQVPRVSDADNRSEFETILKNRIENDWDQFVDLSLVPEPLSHVLGDLLKKVPAQRLDAAEVLQRCTAELVAFLRSSEQVGDLNSGKFSALEEFEQIDAYIKTPKIVSLIPQNRKQRLVRRLVDLKRMAGFDEATRARIEELLTVLG